MIDTQRAAEFQSEENARDDRAELSAEMDDHNNADTQDLPTAYHQLKAAADFGRATFLAGGKCIPAFDARLMAMLGGRYIGETPDGEASSLDIMKAWSGAWHEANLATPVPRLHVI